MTSARKDRMLYEVMTSARERIEDILASHGCMDRWGETPGEREELEPYKQKMLDDIMAIVDEAYKLGSGVQAAVDAALEHQPAQAWTMPDFVDVPTMNSQDTAYGHKLATHIRQELTDELTDEPCIDE